MNPAHLHLLVNHVPVIGTLIAIAILAWGVVRWNPTLVRTALVMMVIIGLAGIGVYLTGEPAEEIVEELAGVSGSSVEAHEEAALFATALLAALAAAALGGLLRYGRGGQVIPRGFATVMLVLSLAPAVAMGWTANLGGQIRHTEIRASAGGSADSPAAMTNVPYQARE